MTVPPITDREIESMGRPDSELPPELRHEKIREVRDVGLKGQFAYQIVFDQHWLPYNYWNPRPEGWEITYARVEWHKPEKFLGFLRPEKECITIVVTMDWETDQ